MKSKWIKKDREWSAYPVGTRAKTLTGASWAKTDRGWRKGESYRLYPQPGGDCIDVVCLPVLDYGVVEKLIAFFEKKVKDYSQLVKTLEYNLEEGNYKHWADEKEAKALLAVWKTHIKHYQEALSALRPT